MDKRIDTIATTIRLGGDVASLMDLELAYAPPYSSAKDPVNMLGFVADNVLKGLVSFVGYDEVDRDGKYVGGEESVVLDIREEEERAVKEFTTDVAIPLSQLRKRYHELDPKKLTVLFCPAGIRAYSAARVLAQKGFEKVKIYPGGVRFHEAQNYRNLIENTEANSMAQRRKNCNKRHRNRKLSGGYYRGLQRHAVSGAVDESLWHDEGYGKGRNIEGNGDGLWFRQRCGGLEQENGQYTAESGKRQQSNNGLCAEGNRDAVDTASTAAIQEKAHCHGERPSSSLADMDKVMASFIIANGAAAMGREVTMFFTFWGLNVLRKSETTGEKVADFFDVRQNDAARSRELKISKMNMGGMGTSMMKK